MLGNPIRPLPFRCGHAVSFNRPRLSFIGGLMLWVAVLGFGLRLAAQPGAVDVSEGVLPRLLSDSGSISPTAAARLADGKVLVAGYFDLWNGFHRQGLVRLNQDGTVDESFVAPNEIARGATQLLPLPDGKLLVLNPLAKALGTRLPFVRLLPDGHLDPTFQAVNVFQSPPKSLAVDAGQRIYGIISSYNALTNPVPNYVARWSADGQLDLTFLPNLGQHFQSVTVSAIYPERDGGVTLTGRFSSGSRTNLAAVRLSSIGQYLAEFTLPEPVSNSSLIADGEAGYVLINSWVVATNVVFTVSKLDADLRLREGTAPVTNQFPGYQRVSVLGREPEGRIFLKNLAWDYPLQKEVVEVRALLPDGQFDPGFSMASFMNRYGYGSAGIDWFVAGASHGWVYGIFDSINAVPCGRFAPLILDQKPAISVYSWIVPQSSRFAAGEADGWFRIGVQRRNGTLCEGAVRYEVVPSNGLMRVEPQIGTLVFTNGQSVAELSIALLDDEVGGNSSFQVRMTGAEAGSLIAPVAVTVSVRDDEQFGSVRFNYDYFELQGKVFPEKATNLVLTVFRSGDTNGAASVRYRLEGTAIRGQDYLGDDGVLQFADGQTEASFEIQLLEDDAFDPDKRLDVVLSEPGGRVMLEAGSYSAGSQMTLNLGDDETGMLVNLYRSAVGFFSQIEANESEGSVAITVQRKGSGTDILKGRLAVIDGDAGGVLADTASLPMEVTLAAGEYSRSWMLPLRNDSKPNPTRELTLELRNLEPIGTGDVSKIELLVYDDDDDAAGTVSALLEMPPDYQYYGKRLLGVDTAGNYYVLSGYWSDAEVVRILPNGEVDLRWQGVGRGVVRFLLRSDGGAFANINESWRSFSFDGSPVSESVSDFLVRSVYAKPTDPVIASENGLVTWSAYGGYRLTKELRNTIPLPAKHVWGTVLALAEQADGRLLIAGSFTNVGIRPAAAVARLNLDSSLDTSFNVGIGPDGPVSKLVVQNDGKILVAGAFGRFAGQARGGLARLLPDGTLDPDFSPVGAAFPKETEWGTISGAVGSQHKIRALLAQRDGRVFVGGTFTNFNGQPCGRFAQLLPNGQLDPGFKTWPGANGSVEDAFELSDGDLAITGDFHWVNGSSLSGGFARLRASQRPVIGFAEPSLGASRASGSLRFTISRKGDPSLAVSARLTAREGTARAGFDFPATDLDVEFVPGETNLTFSLPLPATAPYQGKRTFSLELADASPNATLGRRQVNASIYGEAPGSLDLSTRWVSDEFYEVRQLTPLDEGGWLAVGRAKGMPWEVFRLNADGSMNREWLVSKPYSEFAPNYTSVAAPTPDGNTLVGARGPFTINSTFPVIRLKSDGTMDNTFRNRYLDGFNGSVSSMAVLPDGRFYLGGSGSTRFVRRRPDGSPDTGFSNPFGTEVWSLSALSLQPDGSLYGGALISSYYAWNGYWPVFRVLPNGSLDRSYQPHVFGNPRCFARYSDGGMLVGGWLDESPTDPGRYGVARIHPNGNLIVSAGVPTDGFVHAIAPTADGKYWIGGDFTRVHGVRRPGLARLNPDLSLDTGWDLGEGITGIVRALGVMPNGGLLVGGLFDLADGQRCSGLIRLRGNMVPGGIEFAADTMSARGGDGDTEVVVKRVGGNFGRQRVRVTTGGGTATPGTDYLPVDEVLEFDDFDDSSHVVRIPLLASPANPGLLTVGLRLSAVDSATRLGNRSRAQLLITSQQLGLPSPDLIEPTGHARDSLVVLADGTFITRGTNFGRLVRILPDGQVDRDFSFSVPGWDVMGLAVLPDGRLIVGAPADFVVRHARGTTTNLVRLNPDGSVDPTFRSPRIPDGARLRVFPLPDGRLLVANGRIFRLRADGSLDATFSCPLGQPFGLALQRDGRLLVGVGLRAVNGSNLAGVVRLSPEGRPESPMLATVGAGSGFEVVDDLAVQADGRIVIVGPFTRVNGVPQASVARLWPDGRLDASFAPKIAFRGALTRVVIGPDGMIYVAGNFDRVNEKPHWMLVRFFPDGRLDSSFSIQPPTAQGFVNAAAFLPDGDLLLGGDFNWLSPLHHLLRIPLPKPQPALVELQKITPGSDFSVGDTLTFTTRATDPDTVIARVEIWQDGLRRLAGIEDDSGQIQVSLADAGSYTLGAVAIDVTGNRTVSGSFRVLVRAPGAALVTRTVVEADGRLRIEASVTPGKAYRLERSADLFHWEDLAGVTASSDTLVLHDGESSASAQFYRVVQDTP